MTALTLTAIRERLRKRNRAAKLPPDPQILIRAELRRRLEETLGRELNGHELLLMNRAGNDLLDHCTKEARKRR